MNKLVVLLLLVLGVQALSAEPTARVFGLNLFSLPVDVGLGEVWQAAGLPARGASLMATVPAGTSLAVQFRRTGVAMWSLAKGPGGAPAPATLEADAVYLLVVRQNGSGSLEKLSATDAPAAKVLFVNGARTPAVLFRLGTSAAADGLEPGWSAFVDAAPGRQVLTWSWPTMPPGTDLYKADSPQPGRPGAIDLVAGHWYAAVVSSSNGQVLDLGAN